MSVFYLDTSAVVKLFVQESGTSWLRTLVNTAHFHTFYTSRLAGPECVSALLRKARIGAITAAHAAFLVASFKVGWQSQFQIIEISVAVADQAMNLGERHGLRGYDSVHLAAALSVQSLHQTLQLQPLIFLSADVEQLRAAQAEGLQADNPDNHP